MQAVRYLVDVVRHARELAYLRHLLGCDARLDLPLGDERAQVLILADTSLGGSRLEREILECIELKEDGVAPLLG